MLPAALRTLLAQQPPASRPGAVPSSRPAVSSSVASQSPSSWRAGVAFVLVVVVVLSLLGKSAFGQKNW